MTGRRLEWVRPVDLPPDPANPKNHQGSMIRRSISELGFIEPIAVDDRTGRIISGHGRREQLLAAEAAGEPAPDGVETDEAGRWLVPVVRGWASRDDDHAKAALVVLNRAVEAGGWQPEALVPLLEGLDASPLDLLLSGFSRVDLDAMIAELQPAPVSKNDLDDIPEPPDPVTQLGDLWRLGPHRLLCGDATVPTTVERLLAGERPHAVYTDPPYGMDLDPRYDLMHTARSHRVTGFRFDPVIGDDAAFDAAPVLAMLDDVEEQFWWGADYYRQSLPDGGSWIVWDKRANESGMDLDAVIGGHFELCWSRRSHRREIARVLWSGHHGMQGTDAGRRVHPTQKPVALALWFFDRWMPPGVVILDLFAGSGSTLIAAHETGRRAFLLEIDPRYCDVICARWEAHTGVPAVREGS